MKFKYSAHSLQRIRDRGTNKKEVEISINQGSRKPARQGRIQCERTFAFNGNYKGTNYKNKKVIVIVSMNNSDECEIISVLTKFF